MLTMTASNSTFWISSECEAKRLSLGILYLSPNSLRPFSKGSAMATTSMNDEYSLAK